MSEPLKDEERELILSLYIDGELEPARRLQVDEKLRGDPGWQAEYKALTGSDQRVSKVVQDSWHDPEFTGKVMDRITKQGVHTSPEWAADPVSAPAPVQDVRKQALKDKRVRLLIGTAVAASLSLFAVSLWFLLGRSKPLSNPLPDLVATVEAKDVKLDMDLSRFPGYKAGNVHLHQIITVKAESTAVRYADGSRLWLRQDAIVRTLGARSIEVLKGSFLIEVARGTQPFELKLPDESKLKVLGTRFEVEARDNGTRVRVLEGLIERSGGKLAAPVQARGGEELTAEGVARVFDPREVALTWLDLAGKDAAAVAGLPAVFAAPWPQLGGNPGHSGETPLHGPAGLVGTRFVTFPAASAGTPEESNQYAPAVIAAGGRVFVLRRTGVGRIQLYGWDLQHSGETVWKACGDSIPGNAQHPPVVTARGLVVAGASGNVLQAWDPEKGVVAWRKDVESSVYALCAAYDGNIYCSTYQRLVVLDGHGEKVWAYPNIKDVQAPASILKDGTVLVAARDGKSALLDREGKLLEMFDGLPAPGGNVFWPPVDGGNGQGFWITSGSGGLTRVVKDKGMEDAGLSGAKLTALPLAGGVLALGNTLRFGLAEGSNTVTLPIQGEVVAMARDGKGLVYAAAKHTLYRLQDGKLKDFSAVKKGEIVRGGVALMQGRVVVTTSEGIQIFE